MRDPDTASSDGSVHPTPSLSAREKADLVKVMLTGDPTIVAAWVDVHMVAGEVLYLVIVERDGGAGPGRFETCCSSVFGERIQTAEVDSVTNPYRCKPAFYVRTGLR